MSSHPEPVPVCSRCLNPIPAGEQHEFNGAIVCERCEVQLAVQALAGLSGLADLPLKD